MSANTDTFVVLTALDLEYEAVRRLLTEVEEVDPVAGTHFEVGTVRGHQTRIALMVAGKGNHSAAVLTERAISKFNPRAVMCVGVAGALHDSISLGDVVVATQVYAYHGGTSEDNHFGSRPRAWQAPHDLEQLARQIRRTKSWTSFLKDGDPGTSPEVHFRPIAAGEVVIQSRAAETAKSIRLHYNDTAAAEMEGAGVALAGHLNQKPTIVIRGISDMATATKRSLDREGWQETAATNAAAFAVTLAVECIESRNKQSSDGTPRPGVSIQSHPPAERETAMTVDINNTAESGAYVGMQVGQLWNHGHFHLGHPGHTDNTASITEQLGRLREALRTALNAGRIDQHTLAEAVKEVDAAESAMPHDTPEKRRQVLFSMKRLSGLVGELSQLAAAVSAIITIVGGMK
jgi:8-oxo-dGTP diphosphatase